MAHDNSYTGQKFQVVGNRFARPDGVDKVTGRARYGADANAPGQLVARVLRSPHAHAKIKKIEVILNGAGKPRVIELAHPRRPIQIPTGRRRALSELEIRIVETDPPGPREVGFAEVIVH